MANQASSLTQVSRGRLTIKATHTTIPARGIHGYAGTRNGLDSSGRRCRNTMTPAQTIANASRVPIEIGSPRSFKGNTPAITAAVAPVTSVPTCGVRKRGCTDANIFGRSPSRDIA